MRRQTKITLGEIVLMIVIAAEVVIFIGYKGRLFDIE
jgi:hypothetical protein